MVLHLLAIYNLIYLDDFIWMILIVIIKSRWIFLVSRQEIDNHIYMAALSPVYPFLYQRLTNMTHQRYLNVDTVEVFVNEK